MISCRSASYHFFIFRGFLVRHRKHRNFQRTGLSLEFSCPDHVFPKLLLTSNSLQTPSQPLPFLSQIRLRRVSREGLESAVRAAAAEGVGHVFVVFQRWDGPIFAWKKHLEIQENMSLQVRREGAGGR